MRKIIDTKVRLVFTSGKDEGECDWGEVNWIPQRYWIMS